MFGLQRWNGSNAYGHLITLIFKENIFNFYRIIYNNYDFTVVYTYSWNLQPSLHSFAYQILISKDLQLL
jgi:hypothetical protein